MCENKNVYPSRCKNDHPPIGYATIGNCISCPLCVALEDAATLRTANAELVTKCETRCRKLGEMDDLLRESFKMHSHVYDPREAEIERERKDLMRDV